MHGSFAGGYNRTVRLIVTLLWCLAAICWLPWAALAVRLGIDLLLGTPWEQSYFVKPVLVALWPKAGLLGPWGIVSVWPLGALAGVTLSAVGSARTVKENE